MLSARTRGLYQIGVMMRFVAIFLSLIFISMNLACGTILPQESDSIPSLDINSQNTTHENIEFHLTQYGTCLNGFPEIIYIDQENESLTLYSNMQVFAVGTLATDGKMDLVFNLSTPSSEETATLSCEAHYSDGAIESDCSGTIDNFFEVQCPFVYTQSEFIN